MSHTRLATFSSSNQSSNFQLIIINALDIYKKRTKKDLLAHPLLIELQSCNSPSAILSVLQQQLKGLDQTRRSDERWTRWLDPTVNVLFSLSGTLGEGVELVFSPAKVIFTGVGVLLSAAKDVRASQDTLVDTFERIEMFFRRLDVYTGVPQTNEMMDLIIQIMAEVLSILGIATKEIKQSRIKKYVKKLIGRTKIEDALKKLDNLTREESRMAAAQNLKATHVVDETVKGVGQMVETIDKNVASIDDQVARVDDKVTIVHDHVTCVESRMTGVENQVFVVYDRVATVDDQVASINEKVVTIDDRVKVVDNNLMQVIADGKEAKVSIQQMAVEMDESKRHQLRESTHDWLSPPDPSTNHNIACATHHKKEASWFIQGRIYQEWKSTGSLLWIHGKPGSGKSVICSTVIQDIEAMCKAGPENASMAYFYFDFRDTNKQGLRDLLTSLLIQISASSAPCCDILSDLYLAHNNGKNQPSDSSLAECLKKMVTLPNQPPIYLIIDALDESPDTSGIASPREMVLQFVKELVDLSLSNLHICVTSRPEFVIRNILEPLTSRQISLHEQSGQKRDINDYIRSVVYSDSQQIMKRWKIEDKELVIKMLSERADGMFRWAFCQLEVLRHCLPPSVCHTLDELPESLDETYERVLEEIKKPNRDHAHRLLQCLVVAVRPLRVDELAEVLAVDFDDGGGIPKLNPDWRWEDDEQALLTSCSSLIAIVGTGESRVVQFSHFSVKEFLISTRLANSGKDVSRYHINLEPAHTVLAQACLGALLQPDNCVENNSIWRSLSLTRYAAQYWVRHAQFESVSSSLRKAMEYLFDPDRPHFATWLRLYDVDRNLGVDSSSLSLIATSSLFKASPLYYAALCGFQDLVEHLAIKHPEYVKTDGGSYVTPLVAALAGRHFQTAKFLHDNGSHMDVYYKVEDTPLHSAAWYGDTEMVQVLLGYKLDVNARRYDGCTPLHDAASKSSRLQGIHDIVQSSSDVARILLKRGADVGAEDEKESTPLHEATRNGCVKLVRILLEYGADVNTRTKDGSTPLLMAAESGSVEVVQMLIKHGAAADAKDEESRTLLHGATRNGSVEFVRMLLEHGADVNTRTKHGSTPLLIAAENGSVEVVTMLIKHGAKVDVEDEGGRTPLHGAIRNGSVELVRILLEHGADPNIRTKRGLIPLLMAITNRGIEIVQLLIEHGANTDVEDEEGRIPLHHAAARNWPGCVELVRRLLEHGADVNARTRHGSTPLLMAAENGNVDVVHMLIEHGANTDVEDEEGKTPLHHAMRRKWQWPVQLVRRLLEYGADINARTKLGSTPLLMATIYGNADVMHELLDQGADINARTNDINPLLVAATTGSVNAVRVLLQHGADVEAEDKKGRTSYQIASVKGYNNIVELLSEYGAKGVFSVSTSSLCLPW